MPGSTAIATLRSGVVMPLAVLGLALAANRPCAAQAEPHYWRQPVFFIPYQPNAQDPDLQRVEKVQLLVSRDGGQQWAVLQEANPNVRGFSYHAAADGEYAFALRMQDRRGRVWPEQVRAPLLRVVVDTQPPRLQLSAALDAAGQVVVKYEANDTRLKPQTLRVEAEVAGGQWQPLSIGPPELSQPDRLVGQASWRPPQSTSNVRLRATIVDAAGNQASTSAETSLVGPVLNPSGGPQLAPPSRAGPAISAPALHDPGAPLDWPTTNSFSADRGRGTGSAAVRDPSSAPFQNVNTQATSSSEGRRTGAEFSSGASGAPPLLPLSSDDGPVAGDPGATANLDRWSNSSPPSGIAPAFPAAESAQFNSASSGDPSGTPWVNSLTFDLDYDIQTVGPWGVAKVELWGTKDGGRNWQSLGLDQDNRSPMRVTVPAPGVYGFRIVVDGGNGALAPTPQAGDQPEMVVGVDREAPRTELVAAEPGQGPDVGQVVVRWKAEDENLAPRPVGLFFGPAAEGPWTTIATDLENSGQYAWRLGREAPPRVYLRIEVRDQAGNIGIQQTPNPVDLNLPRPTGRLRQVRPVAQEADRYRTASSRP
ncbi:MAG TPA: hypothetical protein VEQ85_11090, partial [Lacipirellulaceae bacterium]|nr:hypothetical protein [Lacipirellulaceae bacterium]